MSEQVERTVTVVMSSTIAPTAEEVKQSLHVLGAPEDVELLTNELSRLRTHNQLLAIGFRALYLATLQVNMDTEEDRGLQRQLLDSVAMPLDAAKFALGDRWENPQ
jgi:hypothetical protein